ncbi:(Fe-S)-binding protein [Ideonella livida]|uniref:(Fe-S)-binding protein n=1 Tax=Ideonella livida TaxID=2707176 RepID=A0A7C9TL49_9BURK|nr:(Fe-S)-binding protein [Ideonella livida]NDY91765.1 (Fe-S)-binding protein [Ideonella livida]
MDAVLSSSTWIWRDAITAVFWLAVAALVIGTARRAALWRTGRAATVAWSGLLAIPKRYFVDLHHVVAREPAVARAHVAVGGGAIACLLLVALNDGLRLRWPVLDMALVACAGVMLVGAVLMAQRRRQPQVAARVSRGPWQRLPWTLGLGAVGLLALAAAALWHDSIAPWWAALCVLALGVGAAELALGIGLAGPMKHAVAGLLHLGLHPRPERFGDQPVGPAAQRSASALQPVALGQDLPGAAKPADLPWNRLLSFDACVQCGKCEAACPAFAAGQPLNPKKLVQDLVSGMAGTGDAQYAGNPYPGREIGRHAGAPDQAVVPGLIEAETLWSCTTCRACVQACPMLIEHVDLVVDLRRHLTLVGGTVPNKGNEVLAALRETDTQGRYPLAARHHWASDLGLPVLDASPSTATRTEWLLLAGEAGFDLRGQKTLRALVSALKAGGVVPALLGALETDCGDVARRLGDEAGYQRLARQLIATLQAHPAAHLVTADPHLLHALRNEYPLLDEAWARRLASGQTRVWHHTELLADLLERGRLQPRPADGRTPPRVTLHDPCYLGRYNGQTEAPRRALKAIGIPIVEMERCGQNARCCGGGGGAPMTDIPGQRRIPDLRMDDARATGADVVAVACPQCTAMLEGVTGKRPEVLDVAELVARAVQAPGARPQTPAVEKQA